MKLLVRNLARTTTEAELRSMFEVYGRVQACNLVLDAGTGVSKGFGFVEMSAPEAGEAAIQALNGQEVAGHKIRVKEAVPKAAPAEGRNIWKKTRPDNSEPTA
jgi:RNA recognition motif-containing protein